MPATKEFIAFKIDIAKDFIKEFPSWEKTENESKCKYAIENAGFFLGQIQALFDSMFVDQYQETRQDIKEESLVIFYTPVSYNENTPSARRSIHALLGRPSELTALVMMHSMMTLCRLADPAAL